MADETQAGDGKIESLIRSRNDTAGNAILEFFACNAPFYAVYRTETRVLIEFADMADIEKAQRTRLAPLGPLQSEINGLINGWRISTKHRLLAKARVYDRRTADALVMALENDAANAEIELNRVRNAIINARKSVARFLYLIVAFAVAVLVCAVAGVLRLPALGVQDHWQRSGDVLTAVVGGAGGAFFSIATGLTDRTILTDLQKLDNTLDAILRVVIGVLSAAILVCLLRSGLGVTLGDGVRGADDPDFVAWMRLTSIGFLAGFSERMVPDLLEKAGMAVKVTPLPPPQPLATPVRQAPPTPAPAPVAP